METSLAMLFGIVVGMMAVMAILAGRSQGFTSASGGTLSNSPSNTNSAPRR